jgi:hypothetical protein
MRSGVGLGLYEKQDWWDFGGLAGCLMEVVEVERAALCKKTGEEM